MSVEYFLLSKKTCAAAIEIGFFFLYNKNNSVAAHQICIDGGPLEQPILEFHPIRIAGRR